MPPRRPHSKSRLGCKQCKQRRVKCDERYPLCSQCERRDFDCSFQHSGPPPKRKTVIIPTRSSGTSNPDTPGSDHGSPRGWCQSAAPDGPFSRAAELQLMHHWSCQTYKALGDCEYDIDRSQKFIPEVALKAEHLLDSIFALAALHLASEKTDSRDRYGDMAIAYHERAMIRFRAALRDPQPEQGVALFYSSAFIGVITFALPRIHPQEGYGGPVATLVEMSRLFSGTIAVVEMCKEMMGEEEWDRYFPPDRDAKSPVVIPPDVLSVLEKLTHLASEADKQSEEDIGDDMGADYTYSNSVRYLKECMTTVTCDTGAALRWPVQVGVKFNHLLESGDGLARLITLCYGLLLCAIDHKWWAFGSSRDLINELSPLVIKNNPEWSEIADWVRCKAGLLFL